MRTVQQITESVKANPDIVNSAQRITDELITEVRNLVRAANANVPGLDEFLAEVSANSPATSYAIGAGTPAEKLVPDPSGHHHHHDGHHNK
jgi:hypothetical protein